MFNPSYRPPAPIRAKPDPKDFFTPRPEREIADTITMTRTLLFIEPEHVAPIATSLLVGGPVFISPSASPHAVTAARLLTRQWIDVDEPRLDTIGPGDRWMKNNVTYLSSLLNRGDGAIMDYTSFSGTKTHPFPCHASVNLYLKIKTGDRPHADICGPRICVTPLRAVFRISSTTKRLGPKEYDSLSDYLFSTDTGRAQYRDFECAPETYASDGLLTLFRCALPEDFTTVSGPDIESDAWNQPYMMPGEDLTLDMSYPEGITGTYIINRYDRHDNDE